jgi:hypothetical protein
MIYYFHYCNKGSRPFTREWMTDKNLALAELNPEQADFLKESVVLIENRCMCSSRDLSYSALMIIYFSVGIQENSRE